MHPKITEFLQSRIDAGDFPSAVYLVGDKGKIVFQDALGYAVVEPQRIEARLDTIYDLASLTKVTCSCLLLARLVQDGQLTIDEKVRRYLPDFNRGDKSNLTVRQILAHVAGFPDWRPFYLLADDRADVLRMLAETSLSHVPEEKVVYSDLGFSVLTFLTEKLCEMAIDRAFDELIAIPLDLSETVFNPTASLKQRISASEKGNEFEKQMCVEKGYLQPPATAGGSDRSSAFRNGMIWGEVHDGNAYFMGGVAGHAGLFSTAEEIFKIALQFLPNYTQLLKPETCKLFTTNFTKGLNEDRSFAFQLASTEGSTASSRISPESFGHTGFTGTSLWIDPGKERVFVLLTNRTHNHGLPFVNINSVRRDFHDLAVEALENKGSN